MKTTQVRKLLRLPVAAFFLALLGVLINFAGWYLFDSRSIAIIGLALVVVGVIAGIVGVAIGQITVLKDQLPKKNEDNQ